MTEKSGEDSDWLETAGPQEQPAVRSLDFSLPLVPQTGHWKNYSPGRPISTEQALRNACSLVPREPGKRSRARQEVLGSDPLLPPNTTGSLRPHLTSKCCSESLRSLPHQAVKGAFVPSREEQGKPEGTQDFALLRAQSVETT